MDLYETLGLPASASEAAIRHRYRELAMQLHPDLNAGISEDRFKELQIAYRTLRDPDQRRAYDQFLAMAHAARAASRPKPSASPAPAPASPRSAPASRATPATAPASAAARMRSAENKPAQVPVPEATVPPAPSELRARQVGANSIRLEWTTPTGSATGFGIYRWSGAEPAFLANVGADATSFVDRNLEFGAYHYQVTAFNTAGESHATEWVSTGVTDPRPSPPSSFQVTGTTFSSATLGWEADPEEVDSFHLFREQGARSDQIATLDPAARSYVDSQLEQGTYAYYIAAVNVAGASKRVGPAEAHIDAAEPETASP